MYPTLQHLGYSSGRDIFSADELTELGTKKRVAEHLFSLHHQKIALAESGCKFLYMTIGLIPQPGNLFDIAHRLPGFSPSRLDNSTDIV